MFIFFIPIGRILSYGSADFIIDSDDGRVKTLIKRLHIIIKNDFPKHIFLVFSLATLCHYGCGFK